MSESQRNLVSLSFSPLGDRALLLDLGERPDPAVTARVRALADHLRAQNLPGVTDLVPAFCTLAVHYDPELWREEGDSRSSYEVFVAKLQTVLPDLDSLPSPEGRLIEIPVCYGGEYGEDLTALVRAHELTVEQAVEAHSAHTYTVYMLGFAPGFAYLGPLDERLVTPRRDTPRAQVPAGSVAIANEFTGIYPVALPGGWHIIGRTPLTMFDASSDPPSLLTAGDRVRFVPIKPERFRELQGDRA